MGYLERFIIKQRLHDLFLFAPSETNNHCGFEPTTLANRTLPAVLVADILVEIDQVLRVVGTGDSLTQLARHWQQFIATATSLERFHAKLPNFVESLAALPRHRDPLSCPRVLVTGDFFTRFSPFFMEGVCDLYNERGIILKPVDLNDLILYGAYYAVAKGAWNWGLKPGGMALAKACMRIFRPDGKSYLQQWLAYHADSRAEQYYRGLFQKSGLSSAIARNVSSLFSKASEHVSATIFGEVIPTVGDGVEAESEGYDGVIVIGPFNCLPFRISEAILKPLCLQHGMPILTYESDGFAVSPSFLRQVDVHAQQVLEHRSRTLARACA
jgi:predicted nucleotide-binding protein (sugar kinase/HSP70/actin superfamily)